MHGYEIIVFVLLFVTGQIAAADDNKKATITANVTTAVDAIANATESSTSSTTATATVTTLTTASTEKLLASTTIQPLKLLDDLVLADKTVSKSRSSDDDDTDTDTDVDDDDDVGQPNSENGPTAKRTINSKFDGPIVVGEQVNLFTPNNDNGFARRQRINVQIIEPEPHNNGQFLKETVFVRQENNTVITTTKTITATPTQRPTPPPRPKNIVVEQKFLTPIQAGLRLSHDARQQTSKDDDCDDDKIQRTHIVVTERNNNRIAENVDIQQNTKIQRVIYKEQPKQSQTFVFGARVPSTTQSPCERSLPCSTPRVFVPASTPRLRPTALPRIVTSTVVSAPRIVTSPFSVISPPPPTPLPAPLPVTPIPIRTVTKVTEKPVYIHTHSEVPVVQKEYIHLPPRIIEKPVIHKQVVQLPPQVRIVERQKVVPVITEKPVYIHTHSEVPVVQKEYIHLPPKIIEKPVVHKQVVQLPPQVQIVERPKIVVQKEFVQLPPQEKIVPVEVEKLVVQEVPVNNIVEKHIQHPPTVVEKLVPYPVSVPSRPIEVQKIVQVPVDRVVEKPVQVNHVVEKQVPVPYVQYVERPIHIPYFLPVEVPVAYHVPYLVKPPPPPQPKQHIIIKTTKYGKGHHGLFDWKHNYHKHIKHVILKKPTHIVPEDIIAPPSIESIGLLPPPLYQPYHVSDDFGPKASASINVAHAVLPNSVHSNRDQYFDSSPPIYNGFGNFDDKLKYVDSFTKDIRWEFGFKPPLVPSVAIDEFGNPLNEQK